MSTEATGSAMSLSAALSTTSAPSQLPSAKPTITDQYFTREFGNPEQVANAKQRFITQLKGICNKAKQGDLDAINKVIRASLYTSFNIRETLKEFGVLHTSSTSYRIGILTGDNDNYTLEIGYRNSRETQSLTKKQVQTIIEKASPHLDNPGDTRLMQIHGLTNALKSTESEEKETKQANSTSSTTTSSNASSLTSVPNQPQSDADELAARYFAKYFGSPENVKSIKQRFVTQLKQACAQAKQGNVDAINKVVKASAFTPFKIHKLLYELGVLYHPSTSTSIGQINSNKDRYTIEVTYKAQEKSILSLTKQQMEKIIEEATPGLENPQDSWLMNIHGFTNVFTSTEADEKEARQNAQQQADSGSSCIVS